MNDSDALSLPFGFRAGSATAGIKASGRPDIAVMIADRPCSAAAVFTRNLWAAAPVARGRRVTAGGVLEGVVVNSGNANAATGERGARDAERMAAVAAEELAAHAADARKPHPEHLLVCSTGVIGVPLPMEKVEAGIAAALAALGDDEAAWQGAERAIMTTDTVPKIAGRTIDIGADAPVRLFGMAKGAGMIHPDMATMLAFFFTDVAMPSPLLAKTFREAVDQSFNAITIDGDTSTNDTAAILASGAAGVEVREGAPLLEFREALDDLALELAKRIVRDQEGGIATLCCIEIEGAPDHHSAKVLAATVATSPLFKSALHGADPNWGRIVAALGRAGVHVHPEATDLWLGPHQLLASGRPLPFDERAASMYLKQPETHLRVRVGAGHGTFRYYTGDLSEEYVTFNADYTT